MQGLLSFYMMEDNLTESRGKAIGKVEESTECKDFEWEICDFRATVKSFSSFHSFKSPDFSFKDDVWWLELVIGRNAYFSELGVWRRNLEQKHSVEYYIRLITPKGRLKFELSGVLNKHEECSGLVDFIKMDELFKRRSVFMPGLVLIIACTLKLRAEVTDSTQADKTKSFKLLSLEKLSDSFKILFGNEESSDTTLKVKDKDFRVHRSVLIARSSVFAAAFRHDTSFESLTGFINIPDCDPDSFQDFLAYLYCGKLEDLSLNNALNLYYTSDKYDVQELKAFCVEYILHSLTIENVCEIAGLANLYNDQKLFSAIQEFFNKNSFEIFSTTEWESLLTTDHRLANKLLKEMAKTKIKK